MCLRGTMSSCGIAGSRSRASRVPVAAALSPSVSQALSQNMAWSQKAADYIPVTHLLHRNWVPHDSSTARRKLVAARSTASEASTVAPDEALEEGEAGEDEDEELEELSVAQHIIIEPEFSPVTQQLRDVFDDRFKDPRAIHPDRFLWDYWHIPNQYTLMRTQAQAYFDSVLYATLQDALLAYGETRLGCRAITPIWMSYYMDGCVQELHCDNPHGPFAFVLSLTHWDERPFTGGETMILQPHVLDYWRGHSSRKGMEMPQLVTLVEPLFNQLTVFDPRFPHGVRPVHGTRDPMKSRLVLHGWFTQPSPFFEGGLSEEQAAGPLAAAMESFAEDAALLPPATGIMTVRVDVSGASGEVSNIEFLADTLVVVPGHEPESHNLRATLQHVLVETLALAEFPKAEDGRDSSITLPVVFD